MVIALVIGGILVGVVLLVVVIALVSRAALRAMEGPLKARAAAKFPAGAIIAADYQANSFGLESRGKLQARGNGALVLTPHEVCFLQYIPESEVVIPLDRVLETSFTRAHLGKATPFKLLKIRFRTEAGTDAIAVLMRHPEPFHRRLEEERGKVSPVVPVS